MPSANPGTSCRKKAGPVVRDLSGKVLADQMVQHVYSMQDGLIKHMEIRKFDGST